MVTFLSLSVSFFLALLLFFVDIFSCVWLTIDADLRAICQEPGAVHSLDLFNTFKEQGVRESLNLGHLLHLPA